jgi:hypothetical protein
VLEVVHEGGRRRLSELERRAGARVDEFEPQGMKH